MKVPIQAIGVRDEQTVGGLLVHTQGALRQETGGACATDRQRRLDLAVAVHAQPRQRDPAKVLVPAQASNR